MAVDTALHIGSFNTAMPSNSDDVAEGDNNLRHIKEVLKRDFPSITGAVTATHAELNYVAGVTSAIQTQLDAKADTTGETYTGAHDFTGATLTAATQTSSDSSNKAATTAMVQAAIASVNATSSVSFSASSSASFSVSSGQIMAATNASAVAVTFPTSPSTGAVAGVIFDNGLATNTVDLGSNGIKHNGTVISGVITNGARVPMVLRWGGDYWRFV